MSGIRKPRPSGLLVFWGLFGAIERVTQLELEAVRARDFQSMAALFEEKQADFARLHALGQRLGMTRQHPELNRRLLALEMAQSCIADAAGSEAEVLRMEWQDAGKENHQLLSLKRAYVSDTLPSDFQAEG